MTKENREKIIDRAIDFIATNTKDESYRRGQAIIAELQLVKNCNLSDVGNRCSKCDIELIEGTECPLFDDCPNGLPYQH